MKLFKYFIGFILIFSSQVMIANEEVDISDEGDSVEEQVTDEFLENIKQFNGEEEELNDWYFVKSVKRFSDLDKDEYSFKVILNNNHSFDVPATLDEVLNNKIYENQIFYLFSEEFEYNQPWLSTFTYESEDGTYLKGKFDSINSHWRPSGVEKTVSIVKKEGFRMMGSSFNLVYFSDGSYTNNREMFLKSAVGDLFFQLQPPKGDVPTLLIDHKDGRLIRGRIENQQFIQVTW